MALDNLYPPVIDTYMPAFIIAQDKDKSDSYCDVYFSLSNYNAKGSGIQSVWVSVSNQYTNNTVLNIFDNSTSRAGHYHPTGQIKINFSDVEVDNSREGNDKYKIRIYGSDLRDGWGVNEIYKVQLRFCSKEAVDNTMASVTENLDFFSEWSTVCLIQGILRPKVELVNFNGDLGAESIFTFIGNNIVGHLDFQNTDQMESYEISIYRGQDLDEMVYTTGKLYPELNAPNEVNCYLKYSLLEGEKYLLKFSYSTSKMYEGSQDFPFIILSDVGEVLKAELTAEAENELGRIKIHAFSKFEYMFGNLVIRRASSKTNFTYWEDVHIETIVDSKLLDYVWYDYAIESGVWYKYCIQKVNNIGGRGTIVSIKEPVMLLLEDMFLVGDNRQLKIKFNPQVGSMSQTVLESSVQAIGSKYPFIKRNADVNYKQFTISGLISHFCDEEELFISKKELLNNYNDLYEDYNDINKITPYNDFTLEKEFRESVKNFLYDGKVKLFKSPSEGTILVRLMNISMSPEVTLGRLLYSFSATACEIADYNIYNVDKYNIQTVGEYEGRAVREYSRDKRTIQIIANKEVNLLDALTEEESKYASSQLKREVCRITNLSLKIHPTESSSYDTINLNEMKIVTGDANGDGRNYVYLNGYLLNINGEPYYYSPDIDSYNLEDVNITKLVIAYGGNEKQIELQCTYDVKEMEDTSLITQRESYYTRAGQLADILACTDDVVERISDKYYQVNGLNYERLFSISKIRLEGTSSTVFYLKDASQETYTRLVLGPTQMLDLQDHGFNIEHLYCSGTYLAPGEWIDKSTASPYAEPGSVSSKDLVDRGVYKIRYDEKSENEGSPFQSDNVYYIKAPTSDVNDYMIFLKRALRPIGNEYWNMIYYNQNWYHFDKNSGIMFNFPYVLIDYYYELEKGQYFSE